MADFDAAKPEDIVKLQENINNFNKLSAHGSKPLALSGVMDAPTKAAWVAFKKEEFADGQLSYGYVKDRLGAEKLAALGVDTDPKKFDRKNPPEAAVEGIRTLLHLNKTDGHESAAFSSAVKKDKREHWIDDRTNKGALDDLDKKHDARGKDRAEMLDMTAGAPALGKGDAGTGVAILQQFLASEKGGHHKLAVDGVFDDKTKAALVDYQKQVNTQRRHEGGVQVGTDGVMGMETFEAMKANGFDVATQRTDLTRHIAADKENGGHLGEQLDRSNRMRAAVLEAKGLYTQAGGTGASEATGTPSQSVGGTAPKNNDVKR